MFNHPGDPETPLSHPSHRRVSDQHIGYPDRSISPISRNNTPGLFGEHTRTLSLPHPHFDPSLARSPSPLPFPSAYNQSHSAPHLSSYRGLSPLHTHHNANLSPTVAPLTNYTNAEWQALQTRVSELEVINDFCTRRNADLEAEKMRDTETIRQLTQELEVLKEANAARSRMESRIDDTNASRTNSPANGNGKRTRSGTTSSMTGRVAKTAKAMVMSNAVSIAT